jgi:hypothetical protein
MARAAEVVYSVRLARETSESETVRDEDRDSRERGNSGEREKGARESEREGRGGSGLLWVRLREKKKNERMSSVE